jgi:hypothetical protein
MKNFKWKLDFSLLDDKNDLPNDVKKYVENLVLSTLNNRYKDGLDYKKQRELFKVLDKINQSTTDYVELEDSEFEFLEDVFLNSKFPPQFTKVINEIYNNVEEAKIKK